MRASFSLRVFRLFVFLSKQSIFENVGKSIALLQGRRKNFSGIYVYLKNTGNPGKIGMFINK